MKQRKEYDFYCYHCPDNGEYYHNGYTYTFGEDYRSAKRYKEYLDCGFNIVQARGGSEKGNEYKGFWEGSGCQKVFEEYLKAGGKKIWVTDRQLDGWIAHDLDVVGEGKRFASEEELDKAVKASMDGYCHRKGFFGVQLLDEPQYKNFPAYGQVARSIQRVCPTAEIQANLLPIGAPVELLMPEIEFDDSDPTVKFVKKTTHPHEKFEEYEKYVNDFVTLTGLDYVLFDEYPFRREYIISGNTIPNYQLVGRICQKRGLEFRTVLQSFSQVWNHSMQQRYMTESDMYWQTNLALGFGCKEFSFYTYFAKPDFDYKTGFGETDCGAFINLDGSKTALYFYTKRIIAEIKKFSKVGLKYAYENSYIVTEKGKNNTDFEWTTYLYENKQCPFAMDVSRGVALVTEQAGLENKNDKLYMIENISNVRGELFDGVGPMQVRVELPQGKKKFYFRGKKTRVKADKDGKYLLSLKVGDAVFVEMKK